MSKIATYLNEHITGEAVVEGDIIAASSVDGSVLLQRPEMVIHAANTSDIRKIARFCWQLAEKGHKFAITARGEGTDSTGAAIGPGAVLSQVKYMNRVVGIDAKQRLIHVQAGTSCAGISMALSTHKGMTLPHDSFDGSNGSIGGAIASGAAGFLGSRYGTVGDSVQQLEVVLANGDVLQTGKISKRELNSKKGLHTMEGEVYRQVDNLISDNKELLQSVGGGADHDTSGYHAALSRVRRKDGSFDLTPLFIGSQGSLGVITEVILQAQFARQEFSAVLAAYSSMSDAQTAADAAVAAKAISVEIIDGRILQRAALQGKKRDYAPKESFRGALVVALYDDFAERTRDRLAKKLLQQFEKIGKPVFATQRSYSSSELADIRALVSIAEYPTDAGKIVPGVFRGIWLPSVRLSAFLSDLKKLEEAYAISLPIYTDMKTGFVDILPVIDMKKVSDRQKLIKLLTGIAESTSEHEGSFAGYGGDGRIKSVVSQKTLSGDVLELNKQVKQIFDPHGILNPGVKQDMSAKDLVSQLNAWCRALK